MPEETNRFASAAYVPFVGWLFPMAVKGNGTFAMDHAKQGFVLACFCVAVLMGLFLIGLLVPSSVHVLRLVLALIIYGVYGFYFFLCGLGTYYVRKGKFQSFPLVREFTGKLGF